MKLFYTFSYFTLFIFLFCSISSADELLVPDDFPTIADAVLASANGDVIRLVSSEVEWGGPITIENKNLTIEGAEEFGRVTTNSIKFDGGGELHYEEVKTLWLKNSSLEIRNIFMQLPIFYLGDSSAAGFGSYPAYIVVDSESALQIYNSTFHCPFLIEGEIKASDSEFRGYSFIRFASPYSSYTRPITSLTIQNGLDQVYEFADCQISDEGYHALEIRDCKNCSFDLTYSSIRGGSFQYENSRALRPEPGGDALRVVNCENVSLAGFRSFGGKGAIAFRQIQFVPSGQGGAGMRIINSSVTIEYGKFVGGDGPDATAQLPDPYHAGDGGHGISIENSNVLHGSYVSNGGHGGAESIGSSYPMFGGANGHAVFIDENSTFKHIDDDTSVANWPLHE